MNRKPRMKKNHKILFVAYQFPPQAGAGVHRSLQFVKHLPDFSYTPIVLTIKKEDISKFGSRIDDGLLVNIPESTKIIRLKDGRPMRLIKIFQRLRIYRLVWFLCYPFFWEYSALWPFVSYRKVLKIVSQENIEMVYTSSGPYSPMLLAYLLKKKTGIPWVADLRDPFTDAYFWKFPSKFHWYFMRLFFEKWLYKKVDILVVNTNAVRKLYINRKLSLPEKIKVITNGY